jgi:hypothetical protein
MPDFHLLNITREVSLRQHRALARSNWHTFVSIIITAFEIHQVSLNACHYPQYMVRLGVCR